MDPRDEQKLAVLAELEPEEKGEYRNGLQLLRETVAGRARCKERIVLERLADEVVKERFRRGEPAVRREELDFSYRSFFTYAARIEQLFKKKGVLNGYNPDWERHLKECRLGLVDLAGLMEEFRAVGKAYHFILVEALKPVYEKYREMYEPLFDGSGWLRPYCYICGGDPEMAVIEGESGKKSLYCGLCDASWQYLRLKCPFCGNEDQTRLVSVSVDGDTSYSVEACTVCNRYLKVVDGRARGRLFLEVEALLSSHLDGVATQEGFV